MKGLDSNGSQILIVEATANCKHIVYSLITENSRLDIWNWGWVWSDKNISTILFFIISTDRCGSDTAFDMNEDREKVKLIPKGKGHMHV